MSYSLRFGSYTFPAGFYPADDSLSIVVPSAKLPRADGARQLTGYADGKVVEVRGAIIKGPLDNSDWRTRVDALKAALAGVHDLYFETDRYYRCMQMKDLREPLGPTGYGRLALDLSIQFVGPDPWALDTTVNTDTWSSPTTGTTKNITNGGTEDANPIFTITVGGSGPETIAFTITNNTTGKFFTLAGDVTAGDVIVVDTLEMNPKKKVTIGGVDSMALFESEFFLLDPGVNEIQYDTTSSSAASIVTTWQNRYR